MQNKARWKIFKDEIAPLLNPTTREATVTHYKGYKAMYEHYKNSNLAFESYIIFIQTRKTNA